MDQPAILGGTPLRKQPVPIWPQVSPEGRATVMQVLEGDRWTRHTGTLVETLEKEFAAFNGCRRAVAVINGTVSLQAILEGMRLQPGDEVIVPGYTFISSASSVLEAGGVPVFCDVEPDTYLMDWDSAEQSVTDRTRAVMPVHLSGNVCDMDRGLEFARRHGLRVVEDAAQAHGSQWKGKGVGAIGDAGSFSFQASKSIPAGEGGMVVTDDEELAERVWSIQTLGRRPGAAWYAHYNRGTNYRMMEITAALLLSQLSVAGDYTRRRAENAVRLERALAETPGLRPTRQHAGTSVRAHWHFMFSYDADAFGGLSRGAFLKALGAEGIPCTTGGYNPVYSEPLFRRVKEEYPASFITNPERADYYRSVDCPNTERIKAESVRIPQAFLLSDSANMDAAGEAVARIRARAGDIARRLAS